MSGWNIYSGDSSISITSGINNTTGVLTYGPIVTEQCFGSYEDGYKIEFEDFGNDTHTFTISNPGDCVECNMLVTWFRADNGDIKPLNENAQKQFDVKNVDDCEKVIRTQNPSVYGFINGTVTSEPFLNSDTSYIECGSPGVKAQNGFNENYDMTYGSVKYPSGSAITNTHKISYHVIEGTTAINSGITNNANLKELFIPNSVNEIGNGVFSGNSVLTAVTIASANTIGNYAFANCSGLAQVNLNNSSAYTKSTNCSTGTLRNIGEGAFSGCSSIVNLEIPSSVSAISQNAFANCSGMKRLVVPFRALANSSEFSFGSGNVGVVVTGTKYGTIDSNVFSGKDVYLYFAEIITDDIDFNLPTYAHTYGKEKWGEFKGDSGWEQ